MALATRIWWSLSGIFEMRIQAALLHAASFTLIDTGAGKGATWFLGEEFALGGKRRRIFVRAFCRFTFFVLASCFR